ncbi:MAG: glycosyltransferase [Alteromonadaceae bacterium]|nr:glycosyltransferase [Alteromonadaceae bacterium]
MRAINQGSIALSSVLAVGFKRRELMRLHPDLVIGTVPAVPTTGAALLCGKILRIPYAIDLRDAWPDLLNDWASWNVGVGNKSWREHLLSRGIGPILFKAIEAAMNYSLRTASGILTTSSWLSSKIFSTTITEKQKPSVVLRNVFPTQSYIGDRTVSASSAPMNELRVLYAGTIGRAQKLENVVDSLKLAQLRGIKVSLRMVGDGASRRSLQGYVRDSGVDVEFLGKLPVDELAEHYLWSDTALVHLTDWDSLRMAIPSKTFELMENRIHITAVVDGEAAEIVESTRSGHVIPPNDPEALCAHWARLIEDPGLLVVSHEGSKWVKRERCVTTPEKLEAFLIAIAEGKDK